MNKLISTGLGSGYIGKGAGSFAAALTCVCLLIFKDSLTNYSQLLLIITLAVTALGIYSSAKVESIWGKDHNKVVIDEIAGQCITLLFIPLSINYIIIGFILFRLFDITKPFYIKSLEKLPGGWGVMADDILAGIYSNILLQLIIIFRIF